MDRNEAIKIVKSHYPANKQMLNEALEFLIPELTESEDERIRKVLIELVKCNERSGYKLLNNVPTSSMIAWLEKQGKQKPTDKVEAKFKVGDWCIDNEDGTIFQIVKVLDNTYTYKTNKGKEYSCSHYSLENDAHLWTIKDAKDGDILELDCGIGIFKDNCIDGYNIHCYCYYSYEDVLEINKDSLYDNYQSHPATKEQCERFFVTMYDAGYEWDTEKKELKKIVQKPADSYCQKNCKGFQETGKCFADGDCKAKREVKFIDIC